MGVYRSLSSVRRNLVDPDEDVETVECIAAQSILLFISALSGHDGVEGCLHAQDHVTLHGRLEQDMGRDGKGRPLPIFRRRNNVDDDDRRPPRREYRSDRGFEG